MQRPPVNNDHKFGVPRVVVAQGVDCILNRREKVEEKKDLQKIPFDDQ
jgi:hypothetical protein